MTPTEEAIFRDKYLRTQERWKNLPPLLGWYRWVFVANRDGGKHWYAHSPVYGYREVGLTMVKRDVHQVLVTGINGELMWINEGKEDFHLFS